MGDTGKQRAIELAEKCGYTIELDGKKLYLVKDDKRMLRKSYMQMYNYLYSKHVRGKNKDE